MSKHAASSEESIYRLPPFYYMHVLDLNSNVTRVEIGPKTFVRQDNERVALAPQPMVKVPPRFYCIVKNPVIIDADGRVELDEHGQVQLSHEDHEVRLTRAPFALYPGESLAEAPTKLRVVKADCALRLKAVLDFDGRVAGDEWLFEGPGTYTPRKEVNVVEEVVATVILPNQALKLRAQRETTDRQNRQRVTGEEWLVKQVGAYLPGAYEQVLEVVQATVLTDKLALHVRATRTFTDQLNVTRRNGEEWLVTSTDCESYIADIYEEVVGVIQITTLNSRQYAVILNPVSGDPPKPQLGHRRLIRGDRSFFLQPGESLERGIQDIFVLSEEDGLILKACETFQDEQHNVTRSPGDRWMIRGPAEYVPPVEVEVVTRRKALPLDDNEGIYVRDIKTGRVRAVIGQTYMLTQDEELWAKDLPPAVESLLAGQRDPLADRGMRGGDQSQESSKGKAGVRDKTKVVTLRVPHNAAVQIYDYKAKKARVEFGPDLVMLSPDEHFTQLSLSGGKPKRPNVIKSLCLLLGPDFCTDIVTVETADHARLSLQLSYNWHFNIVEQDDATAAAIFSVPDFVGDLCKAVASRVRGMVAQVQFDDFHKNSARIIRSSVFGVDGDKVKDRFEFPQNRLVITSVDIQSVEPVDQRTRDSLQKSVQLAIEITTNSQEATAKHEADRIEQEARGRLERQRIDDQAEAEKSKRALLELQALSAAVESTGQAKAEAQSRAKASQIEGESAVEMARLKAAATEIETAAELKRLSSARDAELRYMGERDSMEIKKTTEMAEIEAKKFTSMVHVLGADTIRAIATAGPDMQVKLLQSLGLQTTLITDGSSPINLFNAAHGLIGGGNGHSINGGRPKTAKKQAAAYEDDESDD